MLALGCHPASAQSGPFVYVPNTGSNNTSVIDTSTNAVSTTIATGAAPQSVAVRGDEAFVYVVNKNDNTVSVINTGTGAVTATIAVGNAPIGIAITSDGRTAYVTNGTDNTVSVINTSTNTVTTTIAVGSFPQGIALTPDGKLAIVPNFNGNSISIINTATNAVTTLPAGTGPVGVAITPDGKTAYVTNASSNSVSIVDVATKAVVGTIAVGAAPLGVAVAPNGQFAYVVNVNSGTVTIINTSTNTVFTSFILGNLPRGVVFSPDGKYAYVTNFGDNSVSVVDTATRLTVTTLPVGTTPALFPGVCSNGNALLGAGLTFVARTSGALGCTLASGATGASGPIFTGGTLQIAGTISTSLPISLQSQGGTIDTNGNTATLSGPITGPGGLTKVGAGTLILSGTSSYLGATSVNFGTLQAAAANVFSASSAFSVAAGAVLDLNSFNQTIGSLSGAGQVSLGTATLSAGADNTSTTFSGVMSGVGGGFTKIGTGTLTLSGNNSYTGPTNVNGGTLDVEGTIAASSLTTVNSSGLLMGTGTVGSTVVASGGTFQPGSGAPGSFMTVAGNLAFQSGSTYMVQLNPATASFVNVTGAATLNGATSAVFATGNYVANRYTILNAAGGVNGTFNSLVNTNLPSNFKSVLEYDAKHAYLDLSLNFVPPPSSGLSVNQQNVANAIVGYFNRNNGISLVYGGLTPTGLTQASGEIATASQQTTFDAMNLFMGLITDPFMRRGNGVGGSSAASGYAAADDDRARAYAARRGATDAFALVTKAPPVPFTQRWSVWAAGFGGTQKTNGDAVLGSNDTSSSIYGTAVGADYLFSPNTLAGFALAGGGTNFAVNTLGSGRSDLFQAGMYIRHTDGPIYVTGALAYGWQDVVTDRTVTAAGIDHLRAEFNANAYSGRLEGGYRFVGPLTGGVGLTPYAAGLFTTFNLPAYSESVVTGAANFVLAYSSKSVTDSRSELGLRADKSFDVQNAVLTLRGRLAWGHDFDPGRSIAATFQALPGASFVVNGAVQAPDYTLTTASAELKWMNGWSAAATFEGQFSQVTRSYAGKGVVRYTW
jgi:YVTN family beta-propeller protein/autotransporter-associated beta strand protein